MNAYFSKFRPIVDWEWMLVVGLALGAFVSSRLSGDKATEPVESLWLISACCMCFSVRLPAQTGAPAVRPAGTGACFQALVKDAKTRIREIGVDQLGVLQKASPSPVLVDVREDHEWDKSHIPGAIHAGRGVLDVNIESRIPQKATPIVVYCQGGGRSAVAADVLPKMGYTSVTSLAGGLAAYQAAGLPVDQSTPLK